MSSVDSGPYQSRLFNFLAKQSQKVTEKCDRSLRHLRLASITTVQILLYPLYIVLQTTRFASRQVQQAVQQVLPQFSETVNKDDKPTTNKRIQRLLWVSQSLSNTKQPATTAAVEIISVEAIAQTDKNNQTQPNLIESNLTLVPENNSTKARQNNQPQLVESAALQTLADNENLLDRILQKIAWVQQIRVIPPKINPDETAIANNHTPEKLHKHPLTLLDRAIADLEAYLPGVSNNTSILATQSQGHLEETAWWTPANPPLSNIRNREVKIKTSNSPIDKIEALIKAAIDYFFRPTPSLNYQENDQLPYSKSEVNTLTEEHPWLTLKELFGEATPTLTPTSDPPETAKPDYLETQATSVGYIKHPLEILIDWLDQLILWVEELAVKIWNWVKAELPKILNNKN